MLSQQLETEDANANNAISTTQEVLVQSLDGTNLRYLQAEDLNDLY